MALTLDDLGRDLRLGYRRRFWHSYRILAQSLEQVDRDLWRGDRHKFRHGLNRFGFPCQLKGQSCSSNFFPIVRQRINAKVFFALRQVLKDDQIVPSPEVFPEMIVVDEAEPYKDMHKPYKARSISRSFRIGGTSHENVFCSASRRVRTHEAEQSTFSFTEAFVVFYPTVVLNVQKKILLKEKEKRQRRERKGKI